jgi:hypothetical protein
MNDNSNLQKPSIEARQGLIPDDMNVVELDGKKVLVQPSQAKLTMGMEVIIGEEWLPWIIKLKRPKGGQRQKNERSKPQ